MTQQYRGESHVIESQAKSNQVRSSQVNTSQVKSAPLALLTPQQRRQPGSRRRAASVVELGIELRVEISIEIGLELGS